MDIMDTEMMILLKLQSPHIHALISDRTRTRRTVAEARILQQSLLIGLKQNMLLTHTL